MFIERQITNRWIIGTDDVDHSRTLCRALTSRVRYQHAFSQYLLVNLRVPPTAEYEYENAANYRVSSWQELAISEKRPIKCQTQLVRIGAFLVLG